MAGDTFTTCSSAGHPVGVAITDGSREVFAAVDVHYLRPGGGRAAAVVAWDATFSAVLAEWTVLVPEVAPYKPGEFFLRELPALRAVLADLRSLGLLVVDGYVDLDPRGRPGLGAYAHAEFGVPVIGVAKTRFRTASHAVQVRRGRSARPLFVTSAGMSAPEAASLIRRMVGPFRLPDALRRVDALARTGQLQADPARPGDPGLGQQIRTQQVLRSRSRPCLQPCRGDRGASERGLAGPSDDHGF